MLVIKVILILVLGFILYQDVKERQVYWFLFPIIALCAGFLFFFKTLSVVFLASIMLNLIFVSILLLVIFFYTKLKLKTNFKQVFGLGDVLFFFAIAGSFSSISFMVIFTSALIFSLAIHLLLKSNVQSVPLAGYMSLFFGLTYLGFWTGLINSVYQI